MCISVLAPSVKKKYVLIFLKCALVIVLTLGATAQSVRKQTSKATTSEGTARVAEKSGIPAITPSSFGFQCGTGRPTNCPNANWPTSIAQPGMIRLWDSQVQWHRLNTAPGNYNWRTLDAYLDGIAAHQPRDAMYTFGYTPCWNTKGACERAWGSPYPPSDLTASGSPSFNAFVTALATHCSASNHCVKDIIKYWELWNEANAQRYWSGTIPQLYQLMAPAVAIIRERVPGSVVLTPPANRGDTEWMRDWLEEENTRGRLSDVFSFHLYLLNKAPELRFNTVKEMVDLKNKTNGWGNSPWMNTETNFDPSRFACSDEEDECIGEMVRWCLLHYAYGARHLSWFYFNTTIGRSPEYSAAYHLMMNWLIGGHFTGQCRTGGTVVTCPFVDANEHQRLFVWNTNANGSYKPDSQYRDYKDLSGATTALGDGKSINLGVKPIMLEAEN